MTETPVEKVTYAPERTLYPITTDYHWATFDLNATEYVGDTWEPVSGRGHGPFGFGDSDKMDETTVSSDLTVPKLTFKLTVPKQMPEFNRS